jgi:hypothetical protein
MQRAEGAGEAGEREGSVGSVGSVGRGEAGEAGEAGEEFPNHQSPITNHQFPISLLARLFARASDFLPDPKLAIACLQ